MNETERHHWLEHFLAVGLYRGRRSNYPTELKIRLAHIEIVNILAGLLQNRKGHFISRQNKIEVEASFLMADQFFYSRFFTWYNFTSHFVTKQSTFPVQ